MGHGEGRILVAYNAGSRRGRRVLALVRRALDAAGRAPREWDIHTRLPPQGPFDRIWVIGGDGAANAAVNYLLHDDGLPGPFCLIPAGTGNNLAQSLGVPLDPREAIALARTRPAAARIDVLRVDVRAGSTVRWLPWFPILIAGTFGFPSVVAGRYARMRRRPLGRAAALAFGESIYRVLSLRELFLGRRRWETVEIALPEGPRRLEAAALFVGNDATIGGHFRPCPRARMDDGLLDLCVMEGRGSRLRLLGLVAKVGRGAHLDGVPGVHYIQTPGPVGLRFPSGPVRGGMNVDGDILAGGRRFEIRVLPRALEVVVSGIRGA